MTAKYALLSCSLKGGTILTSAGAQSIKNKLISGLESLEILMKVLIRTKIIYVITDSIHEVHVQP